MKNTDFQSLVNSVSAMLCEEETQLSKSVVSRMKEYGYGNPEPGAHGHTTFTNENDPSDQMLVDVPGGEWHHMVKGVVNVIGHMDDGSLEKFFGNQKKLPVKEGYSGGVKKTYEIEASPNVISNFDRFLAHVQWCAGAGHSATIGFEIDGDGADRFKVVNPELPKIKEADIENHTGNYESTHYSD